MQSEKLGIINFFGIFIPGSYISLFILLFVACVFAVFGIKESHQLLLDTIGENPAIFTTSFVFVAYLLGMVIRLYAPDNADRSSTRFLKRFGKKGDWVFEKYPYKDSVASWLSHSGLEDVVRYMEKANKKYGTRTFLNHCKLYIIANNPALARQVILAEARVRFLSGIILVLKYFGLVFCFLAILLFAFKGVKVFAIFYGALLFINFLVYLLLLSRFKFMRRKEVQIVWSSYYIIKQGEGNSADT